MRTLKFLSSLALALALFFTTQISTHAQANFVIETYDVEIQVKSDGVLAIKETIDTLFSSRSHGIYRTIPTRYAVSLEDASASINKTVFFPIRKIVSNTMMDIEEDLNGVVLRLGDPDVYVDGNQTYEIAYEMITRDLGLSQDYFYFNVIGDSWDTQIQNASFTLRFDSSVDWSNFKVFYGTLGSTNQANNNCSFNDAQNEVFCTMISLNNYEALTVSLPLGEYFSFQDNTPYYWVIVLVALFVLLAAGVMFLRYGKDDDLVQPVMFTPPTGVNAAMCGYIIDLQSNTRDVVSLILEWGKQGHIILQEEGDGLRLKKVSELEVDVPLFEKNFFDAIFKQREEVTTSQLDENFAQDLNLAKEQLRRYFGVKDHRLMDEVARKWQVIFGLLTPIAIALHVAVSLYLYLYSVLIAIFAGIIVYTCIVLLYGFALLNKEQYYNNKKRTIGLFVLLGGIYLGFGAVYLFVMRYVESGMMASMLHLFLILANTCIILFLDKRSAYGNRVKGEVLGLKHFIEVAEKDRLELLCRDNPMYFYDILPYAYAFGLSDQWQEHFKTMEIPAPTYYYGSDLSTWILLSHLNRSMYHMQTAMSSVPAPKSGSSGGSFSGGGGGFSGGGFGGGGGGSW
ncbi:MAG: DUF2207 domain-containing protein [Erysipelotrichaceae bacterium]